MTDIDRTLDVASVTIGLAGTAVIVPGARVASILFLRDGLPTARWSASLHGYRAIPGRAIMPGRELLVATGTIGIVAMEPSFESLGVLAGIVLIRTFLGFSLKAEIEERWPW